MNRLIILIIVIQVAGGGGYYGGFRANLGGPYGFGGGIVGIILLLIVLRLLGIL